MQGLALSGVEDSHICKMYVGKCVAALSGMDSNTAGSGTLPLDGTIVDVRDIPHDS